MVKLLQLGVYLDDKFEGKSVQGIVFHGITVDEKVIEGIQHEVDMLSIKRLKVNYVDINGEFNKTILRHFPNLEILQVEPEEGKIIGSSNEWMMRQYTKLQYFHWRGFSETIPELCTFIENNPTIRTFCIDGGCFYTNITRLVQSKVLIHLIIPYTSSFNHYIPIHFINSVFSLVGNHRHIDCRVRRTSGVPILLVKEYRESSII